MRKLIPFLMSLALTTPALAAEPPVNFVYSGDASEEELLTLLAREDIEGLQVIFTWKELEPQKGEYDFSRIEETLAAVSALDKKLFIQLQDRFFSNRARHLPDYLLNDPVYDGGLVAQIDNPGENVPKAQGWVAVQWNDYLRTRYQALLFALAEEFDGRLYGINLPESSADIDKKSDTTGFTCDRYFEVSLENIIFAASVFEDTHVVQYANFWPCEWNNDRGYMERTFTAAIEYGFGVGGPDIVPYRRGQMKNSYPFFNEYQDQLSLIAMAIQEPTLTYTNPETGQKFTREEFVDFATNYLGVDIIFWSPDAPWLND